MLNISHPRLPLAALGIAALLSACGYPARPTGPIPTYSIPAPRVVPDRPLVVVLPGRGDDLDDLKQTGIAAAVQRAWPQVDVLLAGATLGYYFYGNVAVALHDQVIAPAHARGYREIWLAGASMGGMGALLYEKTYPRDVTGLVLMAPYMGEAALVKQVADAGGPKHWDPGPVPVKLDDRDYQHELWRLVKSWDGRPEEARRIWLVCGADDRFIEAARLIASVLPPEHFIQVAGGHDWPYWDAGAEQAFARVAATR